MSKTKTCRIFALTAFVALHLFFFSSCTKQDLRAPAAEEVTKQRIEDLRAAIAASTGALLENVRYDAQQKNFVVSGDAYVSLDDALARFPKEAVLRGGANGMDQRVYMYTVTPSLAPKIVLYADNTVPAEWLAALDQAIVNWNSANSLIQMKRVTSPTITTTTTTTTGSGKKKTTTTTTSTTTSYNVLVTTMYDSGTNAVAMAQYPLYTGAPGKQITINTYHNNISASYKIFTMTHEAGHAIGFTHTNETYGNLVAGTPVSDPNSIMNSVVLPWNGFTSYDLLAVRTVYPK